MSKVGVGSSSKLADGAAASVLASSSMVQPQSSHIYIRKPIYLIAYKLISSKYGVASVFPSSLSTCALKLKNFPGFQTRAEAFGTNCWLRGRCSGNI